MSSSVPVRKPFKIVSDDGNTKKGVTAYSIEDLVDRGIEKLCLPPGSNISLVLEDGTEVDDEDYFQTVPINSTFVFKTSAGGPVFPTTPQKQNKQERTNLWSTTSRYRETGEQKIQVSPPSLLQQPYFKPASTPMPLMSAGVYSTQDQAMALNQQQLNLKPYKGSFTLTFTTENLIDPLRIEAEFRRFGPVTAESDYKRINGRARVFVNFNQAQHAINALQHLRNCFYDLQISKHCLVDQPDKVYNMGNMKSAIEEIPKKKPTIIDEVKRKAQIKEERQLKEKLQQKEKEAAEKNESKVKSYLQEEVDPTECSLCKGTCKRGVKLSCCGVRACRACAVLAVTKTRKCWRIACGHAITTQDIVNDHEMRQKISKLIEGKVEVQVSCA